MSVPILRPLDHLVLPTASIRTARARLTSLGFTVAPDGLHPFGTANCCIYFADGTFLEPLAISDPAQAATSIRNNNVFVARDAAFRAARGDEGFSAIVFGSDDARSDHAEFVSAGISAGDLLDFSRGFTDASGRTGTASFRLAFAADPDTPNLFVFTCQRIDTPNVDRTSLQRHANGVSGIRRIITIDEDDGGLRRLLHTVSGITAGSPIQLGGSRLEFVSPEMAPSAFLTSSARSEQFAAIVFCVGDLEIARAALSAGAIDSQDKDGRLVVDAAPGQGATFVFEQLA